MKYILYTLYNFFNFHDGSSFLVFRMCPWRPETKFSFIKNEARFSALQLII